MRHYKEKHIYIGVDVHKNTHTGVVINCWNEKLDEIGGCFVFNITH